ncbi:MAG: hypothetical protein JWL94_1479, partial [Microbacteriaceae bacterium]|nr:hypothetical protein [Microbacteriaceae bacterium]
MEPLGNDLAFKGYAVDPPSVLQPITEAYTIST